MNEARQTSRELVRRTLTFDNPQRVPRQLWALPWAYSTYPEEMEELEARFPSDITYAPDVYQKSSKRQGDAYEIGEFVDEWGCVFENVHGGVIGEVKKPIIDDLSKAAELVPPYEVLPVDTELARNKVNEFCSDTDKFVLAPCFPRPWERYQFLRGTENALMDVMTMEDNVKEMFETIHNYYMKELEFWVTTDVDAIWFMDDWGSQLQLLIPPQIWRQLFKPMYKDYCDIAKANDKFTFMHSDGCILEIYQDLADVGLNAINSQIFCMDMAEIADKVKGRLTFWGEIDRQHILCSTNTQDAVDAVEKVKKNLYNPSGGVIAQFEFGPGTNPEIATAIFEAWDKV